MKAAALLAIILVAIGCGALAKGGRDETATPKFTEVVLTDDEASKEPKANFGVETPKITVFFRLENVQSGSKLRGAWICEKSESAPPDHPIEEATLDVGPMINSGNFSLSKPTKGWPQGSYRVELFIDDKLAETVKFTVGK